MKKHLFISSLALLAIAGTSHALSIDFETDSGYTAGDLAGQPGSGTQWALTNGGVNVINVATGIGLGGSQGIQGVGTGGGSNFVYYGFNTTNDDLGSTFSSTSSVLQYSFNWRPTQALDGAAVDEIFRITIGSSGDTGGTAAMNLTMRASGRMVALDGTTNRAVDNLFTLNEYATITGTIDYGSNTYTVFVNGTQQYMTVNSGNLSFNNASSDNAFIRIGNLNGGDLDKYRTWNADNISVIPEPGSFALAGGALSMMLVLLRRRRRA